jgi:hypothetical protein
MDLDWTTIHASLHAIATKALAEGIIHHRDKVAVDNAGIHAHVNEALALIRAEIISAEAEADPQHKRLIALAVNGARVGHEHPDADEDELAAQIAPLVIDHIKKENAQ